MTLPAEPIVSRNLFEKYRKLTICLLSIFFLTFVFLLLNGLGSLLGLGKVIIYESSPIYGYRPLPNQEMRRHQATVKINNLGLRANENWDEHGSKNEHILFLGDSVTYGGSYIDNHDLFSHLVATQLKLPLKSGNAGVNAWGVLNVTGLVLDHGFQPAATYVSLFPEGDFYRGMSRIGGMPFWARTPLFALEELIGYFAYKVNSSRYAPLDYQPGTDEGKKIIQIAVDNLKRMDTELKSKGYRHYIFISPSRTQLQGKASKDKDIVDALKVAKLDVVYIWDKLPQKVDLKSTYHDEIHLEKEGHKLWASIISNYINQH